MASPGEEEAYKEAEREIERLTALLGEVWIVEQGEDYNSNDVVHVKRSRDVAVLAAEKLNHGYPKTKDEENHVEWRQGDLFTTVTRYEVEEDEGT